MDEKYGQIKDDFMEEAMRLIEAGKENGLALRLIGCLAFRIQAPEYVELHKAMGREVTDIDFIAYFKQQRKIINLFRDDLGYHWVPPGFARASTLRDLFIDKERQRKVDVFYDHLDFCHNIDFKKKKRLDVEPVTIPLAELFLEKTQIVELNAKDLKDLIVLFLAHDVSAEDDDSQVNGRYISKRLGDDWGFYYTVTENLKKLFDFVPTVDLLSQEQKEIVLTRARNLYQLIEDEPKTKRWRNRAKVGAKKRWYKVVHSMEGTREAS
jgi:hypothetical protein